MKLLKCPLRENVVKWLRLVSTINVLWVRKSEEAEAGAGLMRHPEKHVPVLKVEGDCLTAVVGMFTSNDNPEHLISNI